MEDGLTIREKLSYEIYRFLNRDFLAAAMAACALVAYADKKIKLSERYQIDAILSKDKALSQFDSETATLLLDKDLEDLRQNGAVATQRLHDRVGKMHGHAKRSRTLLRVAYLIITADGDIDELEEIEFVNLCVLLGHDANTVWKELRGERPSL
ncbi:MAG: TerB family tellurite resistance protein [Pseudomonadota bacterium]